MLAINILNVIIRKEFIKFYIFILIIFSIVVLMILFFYEKIENL